MAGGLFFISLLEVDCIHLLMLLMVNRSHDDVVRRDRWVSGARVV